MHKLVEHQHIKYVNKTAVLLYFLGIKKSTKQAGDRSIRLVTPMSGNIYFKTSHQFPLGTKKIFYLLVKKKTFLIRSK
ncbi:unnamed protein product [Leptidea sinapis]|uniref:Uncharacterized protein n=1 Tax=Leptidea sinapis TaxID=189913 RepID=A0A5E4PPJ2_9NEOP|nr:unnamed protein product [Leptidea sinapis]